MVCPSALPRNTLDLIDLAGRPLSLKPFKAWGICFDEPGLFHPEYT